ncbi:MAG: hypothetical protein KJN71_03715 [Acidimicrobiia bacterium]|nr:hypothetical protein [Acidimicrobiia bacterium]NNC75958.1 hypothetical protein [Acidimicrobiia bacterium]
MTALFALSLSLGIVALLAWIVMAALASNLEGWDWLHPDNGLGATGKAVIAAMVGFGMAGISADFAGWATLVGVGAAVAGAVGAVLLTRALD